jgi:hypothetical protein
VVLNTEVRLGAGSVIVLGSSPSAAACPKAHE